MKCQILFSRRNKENIISLPSAQFANSIRSVRIKIIHPKDGMPS